ncbi:MAG: redox-regulated ATPase YchF [Spirochaetaceae bacterium]
MGLNCGIVGLPNVGKSTIFSALTSAPAEAANYPFCTIDPNVGIVDVPDKRLKKIAALIPPQKLIAASVEFVDIAGLVKGASKGEGLGNKFLANIRETGVIIHVVRCFEDADVIHVDNKIDPASDIETINLELAFSDLDSVEKRMQKTIKLVRSNDSDAKKLMPLLEKLKAALENGEPARSLEFTDSEMEIVRPLHLITMKKVLYVCNIDEDALHEDNNHVTVVREIAAKENARAVKICGQLEAEIAELETEVEKEEFLADAGLDESGLSHLIHEGYAMLGLRTYFTAGEIEVRAWTYKEGDKAPQAAGVIHTDFEKGFIKAEVYHCDDLFDLESEANIKSKGKLRIEGKEYVVKDGDVMHFRFNV